MNQGALKGVQCSEPGTSARPWRTRSSCFAYATWSFSTTVTWPRREGEAWDIADAVPAAVRDGYRSYRRLCRPAGALTSWWSRWGRPLAGGSEPPRAPQCQCEHHRRRRPRARPGPAPTQVVILVSNPVDELTRAAIEGFHPAGAPHPGLRHGSSTGARAPAPARQSSSTSRRNLFTPTSSGEHGDSFVFRSGRALPWGAIRPRAVRAARGRHLAVPDQRMSWRRRFNARGQTHPRAEGVFTSYGVAGCRIARPVRAIIRDRKADIHGLRPGRGKNTESGRWCSACLAWFGMRRSLTRQLLLTLSEDEQRILRHSARVLDEAYRAMWRARRARADPGGPGPVRCGARGRALVRTRARCWR